MITEIDLCLCILLIQQVFIIQADDICYYRNQSNIVSIYCKDDCCLGMAISPDTACCSYLSWKTIAVPAFVIIGFCLFAICLIYIRPILKICACGCTCPCRSRSQVTSPSPTLVNDNPVYVRNNDDLPDYDTIIKDSQVKYITPPPYNFVAAHPADFDIEARGPSAPPQYRSRSNSAATTGPSAPAES